MTETINEGGKTERQEGKKFLLSRDQISSATSAHSYDGYFQMRRLFTKFSVKLFDAKKSPSNLDGTVKKAF